MPQDDDDWPDEADFEPQEPVSAVALAHRINDALSLLGLSPAEAGKKLGIDLLMMDRISLGMVEGMGPGALESILERLNRGFE